MRPTPGKNTRHRPRHGSTRPRPFATSHGIPRPGELVPFRSTGPGRSRSTVLSLRYGSLSVFVAVNRCGSLGCFGALVNDGSLSRHGALRQTGSLRPLGSRGSCGSLPQDGSLFVSGSLFCCGAVLRPWIARPRGALCFLALSQIVVLSRDPDLSWESALSLQPDRCADSVLSSIAAR